MKTPYRSGEKPEPESDDEETAGEREESPGMELLRLYRRKFRGIAILAGVGIEVLWSPVYIVVVLMLASAAGWGLVVALAFEAVRGLLYVVSARLGRGAAHDAVREASWGAYTGGWVVSGRGGRGPFWILPLSVALSAWGFLSHGYVLARVLCFLVWAIWAWSTAIEVGVLRWTRTRDGRRAMELEDLAGRRQVELESVDVNAGEVRFVDRGQPVSWQAVSPLETLARDVKKSPLNTL